MWQQGKADLGKFLHILGLFSLFGKDCKHSFEKFANLNVRKLQMQQVVPFYIGRSKILLHLRTFNCSQQNYFDINKYELYNFYFINYIVKILIVIKKINHFLLLKLKYVYIFFQNEY